jgi:predicted metal-dependent peptidase
VRELDRLITTLILEEPFYGHLLGGVARAVDTRTPTAAVGVRGDTLFLWVNPTFFLEVLKSDSERVAVIKHEVLHLVFRHLFRRGPDRHPLLYNLAADLVVNQFVGRRWKLPDSAVTLGSFPELRLKPNDSVENYYAALHRAYQQDRTRFALWLGEGAPTDHSAWGSSALAEAALGRAIRSSWERTHAHGEYVPHFVKQLVEATVVPRPPRVDWKRQLRMFCASQGRTRLTHTLRRPSRRYGGFPGVGKRRLLKLLVAVDTSGSVSDEDLSAFFAEITAMWRAGAEVTVLECDDKLQQCWTFDGRLPRRVGGRGFTSFDPPLQWARRQGTRWDALLYLTDGLAASPKEPPPCPMLWVVSRTGSADHLRFGQVLRLHEPSEPGPAAKSAAPRAG